MKRYEKLKIEIVYFNDDFILASGDWTADDIFEI